MTQRNENVLLFLLSFFIFELSKLAHFPASSLEKRTPLNMKAGQNGFVLGAIYGWFHLIGATITNADGGQAKWDQSFQNPFMAKSYESKFSRY